MIGKSNRALCFLLSLFILLTSSHSFAQSKHLSVLRASENRAVQAKAPEMMPPSPKLPPATLAAMRQKEALRNKQWHFSKSPLRDAGKKDAVNNLPAGVSQKLVSGTKNMPTILGRFPNLSNTYTPTNFQNLLYTPNGIPTGSARDYFQVNSYGALTLAGQTSGAWYTAEHELSYYGFGSGDDRAALFAKEQAQLADAAGFDWAPYDNDHDGYVDTLWVVHSGLGFEETGNFDLIWSHNWDFNSAGIGELVTSTDDPYHSGQKIRINSYIIMPEESNWSGGDGSTRIVGIGVFCHEFGHALGLPDLYDTAGYGAGLGFFSLMAAGSWGGDGNDSRYPVQLDCWSKAELGWINPTVVTINGNYTVHAIENNQSCYLVKPAGSIVDQYFLVENRQKIGFDQNLIGNGLLIYHIDTDIIEEYREWNMINSNFHPYGIALEEADSSGVDSYDNMDLFVGYDMGTSSDPWPYNGKNSFAENTIPSTKTNSGNVQSCRITNIPSKSNSMTVYIQVEVNPNAPKVTGFSPTSGKAGDTVIITGSKLTGATDVKFASTSSSDYIVNSDTRITAIVPVGAATGPISVTTSQGIGSSSGSFNIIFGPEVWSMFRHDTLHTGRSPAIGPKTPGTKWAMNGRYYPTNTSTTGLYSSPVVGPDGTVYASSPSGYYDYYYYYYSSTFQAIDPDGYVKWTRYIGGVSSPALSTDGILYIGAYDGLRAYRTDGVLLWTFELDQNSYIESSPAIGPDGVIYFGTDAGDLYALYPDGETKWVLHIGEFVYSSPAIGPDGTIYVGASESLCAVNPNGTMKWAYTTKNWVVSSPAIALDGTIYIGSEDFNLYAVNPNGSLKWAYNTKNAIDASPAIAADGTIIVSSMNGNLYAINPNGTLQWSVYTGNFMNSSPAIGGDGTIYVGSDNFSLYALNADGTLKWEEPAYGDVASSPAIGANGAIYFSTNYGFVQAVVDAGPPLQLLTNELPSGAVGVPYSASLEAIGGMQPYYWLLWSSLSQTSYVENNPDPDPTGDPIWYEDGVPQNWRGDDTSWIYELPWAFPFYGKTYTSVNVCSNGFLDFTSPAVDSSGGAAALTEAIRIAPFWTDLRTDIGTDDIYVTKTDDYVMFRWQAHKFESNIPVNFEAMLFRNGDIQFNYGNGLLNCWPTIGISGGSTDLSLISQYNVASNMSNVSTQFTPEQVDNGLWLDMYSGMLSGIPTDPGSFVFNVLLWDSGAQYVEKSFNLYIEAGPVALDGSLTAAAGYSCNGQLQVSNTNGSTITYSIVGNPGKGTVSLTDVSSGKYSYKANAGAVGTDSFTFRATSSNGALSNIATVTITIAPPLSAVSLAGSPVSPIVIGSEVSLTAVPTGGAVPEYQFWVKNPGESTKTLLQDYSMDNICPWTPGAYGSYVLLVYAREHGSGSPYQVYQALVYKVVPPLTAVSLSGQPASPVKAGTAVTLTATATGGQQPEYQFLVQNPGATTMTLLRDYATPKTCSWTPSAAGTYVLQVNCREQGSSVPSSVSASINYIVKDALTAVALAGNPASPTATGINVLLTATPTGGLLPEYQFWVRIPGSASKSLLRDYGIANTVSWKPEVAGTYTLLVYAREKGSAAAYQQYKTLSYVVKTPISSVTLSADVPSPMITGKNVILTGTAVGGGTLEYQFWVRVPGSSAKTMLRDYNTGNTCSWTPTVTGSYTLLLYAREKGSAAAYQQYSTLVYQVNLPLSSVTLKGDKPSPVLTGVNINLTAAPGGGGIPEYQFWVRISGSADKTLLRDYNILNTCSWTPGLPGPYTLLVYVREKGNTAAYDVYNTLIYTVTSP